MRSRRLGCSHSISFKVMQRIVSYLIIWENSSQAKPSGLVFNDYSVKEYSPEEQLVIKYQYSFFTQLDHSHRSYIEF